MWKDKVVIITGSSLGIGKKLAIEIGNKGGKIVLNARNKERLKAFENELKSCGIRAISYSGDISKNEDCVALFNYTISKFNRVDILINNAGIASVGNIEEVKPDVFQKVIDVNLMGSVFMTKAVLPEIKQNRGSIMFIGSIAGIHGLPAYSSYSCSKMALTAFAESLKIELNNTGVHVGLAYLGFTENDPKKTFLDQNGKLVPQPARNKIKQVPVGRVAFRIMKMIEKRKFKSTFTLLGKLNNFLNRINPYLVHQILLSQYQKN
ncbi:MAG: SDR family oxidoreductase [Bacteroidetes bacterium]|nr:SDR family oxidoreductase [Bacteroidota bacterium]